MIFALEAAEGPLTRPLSAHPLPQGERVTVPVERASPSPLALPMGEGTGVRGLLP